jgi:uncharacterized membrane protein
MRCSFKGSENFVVPLAIVLIAACFRFTGLTFDGLWLDEGYQTVVESYGNPLPPSKLFNSGAESILVKPSSPASSSDVLENFRKVDPLCPPLYALLMNRWLTIFGGSDFALRAFSATLSALSIAATYLLGVALLGRRIGIFAALLQAVSPFDIAYAQEARMYSLLVFLATISGGSFIMLCRRLRSWHTAGFALLYAGSTWALVNTHYTGLFIWAYEIGVGLLLALFRRDWLLLAWLFLSNLCTALLCLPWFPLFQEASAIRTASFYVSRKASLWWPIWALVGRIPFNWIIFLAGKKVALFAAPIYLTASFILFCGMRNMARSLRILSSKAWRLWQALKGETPDSGCESDEISVQDITCILLVLWCVMPALILWSLDVIEGHRVIEISRYIIGTAPAIYLIGAAGVDRFWRRGRLTALVLVLHLTFALANNVYAHVVHQKEDWREAARLLEQKSLPDDLVFVSHYYDIVCLDRYLTRPMRQVGITPSLGSAKVAKLIDTLASQKQQFWVLTGQEGDQIFSMIPSRYSCDYDQDLHHALHLRHYAK